MEFPLLALFLLFGSCIGEQDAQRSGAARSSMSRVHSKLKVKGLEVMSNEATKKAEIVLGDDGHSIGIDEHGHFGFRYQGVPYVLFDETGMRTTASHIEAGKILTNSVVVNNVAQFSLHHVEDFSQSDFVRGWQVSRNSSSPKNEGEDSYTNVSQCGGIMMLGGACKLGGRTEISKIFKLPESQIAQSTHVKIRANFHFIDQWIGESAYMKVNGEYVWTERHEQDQSSNGISLCGGEVPEGKFSVPVEAVVTIPGGAERVVTVSFGTTMEDSDPCDESWGISGLEISLRNP